MTHDEPDPDLPEAESEPREPSTTGAWTTDFHTQRWLAGDEGGFLALEEHFRPLLLSRVRRSSAWSELARHHEAEEVVRAVLARAFKHGDQPFTSSGKGSFLAMLRRLCDRTLEELLDGLSARRPRSRNGELAPEDQYLDGDSDGTDDEELVALARWTLSERELLAWQHVDRGGFTSEEVGDLVLDCSAAEVDRLLARARVRLESLH